MSDQSDWLAFQPTLSERMLRAAMKDQYRDMQAEIERLRAGLQLIANDKNRLMNEVARQTAASILGGKPIGEVAEWPKRDETPAQLAEAQRFRRSTMYWHERAMKAEARLQKTMARCADLLDEDQFNELDAIARATDSAEACLGGAPHWWDINADTGQTECRLCHKSPTDSASTVSEDCGCPDGHEVHSCCASLCPRSNRDWKRAPPMNAVTVNADPTDAAPQPSASLRCQSEASVILRSIRGDIEAAYNGLDYLTSIHVATAADPNGGRQLAIDAAEIKGRLLQHMKRIDAVVTTSTVPVAPEAK